MLFDLISGGSAVGHAAVSISIAYNTDAVVVLVQRRGKANILNSTMDRAYTWYHRNLFSTRIIDIDPKKREMRVAILGVSRLASLHKAARKHNAIVRPLNDQQLVATSGLCAHAADIVRVFQDGGMMEFPAFVYARYATSHGSFFHKESLVDLLEKKSFDKMPLVFQHLLFGDIIFPSNKHVIVS